LNSGGNAVCSFVQQHTGEYGVSVRENGTTNQVNVVFRQYSFPTGATFGAAGSAWSTVNNWRWRVKKASGGQAVGFGLASTTSAGLVNPYTVGSGVVYGGQYTPTITNVSNVAASTPYSTMYMRVGAYVTVSGMIDIDPTAATTTQFGMSLPIASDFTAVEDCAGTGYSFSDDDATEIAADTSNNRADFRFSATGTANRNHKFTFTYRIR
jgi:hypothetical protein